ncbi:SNU114 [Candida margitis]|uniref:SNU114 n=1 Tax=Candida margitis TaxID=1775924 RepID=UPI00222609F9|nr:SNU114 [Candida margitis]KAI5969380.1 SNU114 [Candida margitis]
MSDDKYDEFGNYIGGSDESESDIESQREDELGQGENELQLIENGKDESSETALVKNNVSTEDAEIVYINPSSFSDNMPVIVPKVEKKMKMVINEENLPKLAYSREFMVNTIREVPERIRNVCIVGNFQCGKTSFIDHLVQRTHADSDSKHSNSKYSKPLRYLDNHKLEIEREASIKSSPITLLLPNSKGRSFVFSLLDTPGHADFGDEVVAGLELSDGAVLVLDVVVGLTFKDKLVLGEVIQRNMPVVLVLNKIDRLILELRLPPKDAYLKLFNIIDDVNQYIIKNSDGDYTQFQKLCPTSNNVVFASSVFGISFTLSSFAKLYSQSQSTEMQLAKFEERLWGDYFFNYENSEIITNSHDGKYSHTFVTFVLDVIYQIAIYALTTKPPYKELAKILWENFGVSIPKAEYKKDVKVLLNSVFRAVFKHDTGFVDSTESSIPPPHISPKDAPLLGKISKFVESPSGASFLALTHIYSGQLNQGDTIKVCIEDDDGEELKETEVVVDHLYLPGGRYNVPVDSISNTLVLIECVDSSIQKGATIISHDNTKDPVFKVPNYAITSVLKVAVEPVNPTERPLLLDGLNKISKSYLSSVIHVEENGDTVVVAPGEFYMDCLLHDLRVYFNNDLQIRVSDPMTIFSETCITQSFTQIPVATRDGEVSISVIAEPVNDVRLSYEIEKGLIDINLSKREMSAILKERFGWDTLAARSIWSFGPDDLIGPDILLDDTLDGETDKEQFSKLKPLIVSGFKWCVNEGPLFNEPIRNVKFKILEANFGEDAESFLNAAQIIPLVRRACYTGLLTAKPRVMEPVYKVDAVCPYKAIRIIKEVLKSRRGTFSGHEPIEGTPLYHVEGFVPVIDSFGMSSDVKLHAQNKVTLSLVFSHWEIVPGDPFDITCPLPTLEPVPEQSLSRDFLLKTRKRKDLTGEPTLQKYIDPEIYQKLKERDLVL